MKKIHNKSEKMKIIENKEGEKIEEILRVKYVDENKSIENICKELNISYVTCLNWIQLAGIYSRKIKI